MGTFRSLSDKLVKSNLGPLDSLVHGKNIWALFNMKLSYTETGLKKKIVVTYIVAYLSCSLL